ncbi:hypothetical protein [Peribacillus simplex]|uniref:hypothetical protein n=1 Tax=Peribacillus simplex TaxID=1478 RepID=UPI003D2A7CA1
MDFTKKKEIFVQHSLYYISGQVLVLQTSKTHSGKRNISITNEMIEDYNLTKFRNRHNFLKWGWVEVNRGSLCRFCFWWRTSQSQYDTQAVSL